jgi:rubrerythrin
MKLPFPETVKAEARRKAHFRCVICHEPFVDVHHMIRESEGGPNTLENAAPLCAKCHDDYGNNPDKRKQIKGMRDLWYDICEKRYSESDIKDYEKLNELYEMTKTVQKDQVKSQEILREIKNTMSGLLNATEDSIKKSGTLNDVITTSGYVTSGTKLGSNVYANVNCRNCGTSIGLLVGTDKCPNCGMPIR